MTYRVLLGSALAALAAGQAAGQTIIAPTSGVINSGGPGFGTLTETFNQAGLFSNYVAGVTNFDAYLAGNPLHTTTFAGFEWFSNSGTTSAQVTYSFGSVVGIDRLALWNEESSGIGTLNLQSSLDGITFSNLGTYNPFNNPRGSNYPAEVFAFGAVNAQFVRFTMSDCPQPEPGTFPSCSIGEVAFRTASVNGIVPEPSTWAIMLLGFFAIGSAMRSRPARQALRFGFR